MIKYNKIPYIGLLACVCYFITTIGLVVTGTATFIVLMELATILSAPALLLIFMCIPTENKPQKEIGKKLSTIFMSSCMILTSMVHFTNIAFIMPLMKEGIDIPIYLQIGQWPSVLMAVDYLGWGFFAGTAFLASSYAVSKHNRTIKYTLLACGALCLMGLLGTVSIHANCWFIAPIGYGIGSVIICIELIVYNKFQIAK